MLSLLRFSAMFDNLNSPAHELGNKNKNRSSEDSNLRRQTGLVLVFNAMELYGILSCILVLQSVGTVRRFSNAVGLVHLSQYKRLF